MGIFDWKHWVVLLIVVVLVFGTKKLKNFGGDLGESIKGFRKAMNDDEAKPDAPVVPPVQPTTQAPAQPYVQPTQQPHNSVPPVQPQTFEGQAQPAQEPQRKD